MVLAAIRYIEKAYVAAIPKAIKNFKKKPSIINNKNNASELPNRNPELTRSEFLLSLNLALCVNQSTVAINGKREITGRYHSIGSLSPKALATKIVIIPKIVPVHLEQR
ncbi:MAG: hypothetical protein NWF05_00220 [Candidatus Bathyarchaeota archaeon]|nr:hypothetical protein [Candidatus Bathyarchaeota archaeon]